MESYSQRLLLTEWYPFELPGDYQIEMSLAATFTTTSGRRVNPQLPPARTLSVLPPRFQRATLARASDQPAGGFL